MPSKPSTQLSKLFFGLLSTCTYFVLLHLTGFDGRLFYHVGHPSRERIERPFEARLHDFVLTASHNIVCLETNLSGITFGPQSRTLFAVTIFPPGWSSWIHPGTASG